MRLTRLNNSSNLEVILFRNKMPDNNAAFGTIQILIGCIHTDKQLEYLDDCIKFSVSNISASKIVDMFKRVGYNTDSVEMPEPVNITRFDISTCDNGEFIEQDRFVHSDGQYVKWSDIEEFVK